jgi:hypothetical protein
MFSALYFTVVSIIKATEYGLEDRALIPNTGVGGFFFSRRPARGFAHPPIKLGTGGKASEA